jgi:carboxylesterase
MKFELFPDPEHEPFVLGHGRGGALLLHGFMGTPAEMRPLAHELSQADHTVHGPLLPGFGRDLPRLGEMRRRDWVRAAQTEWEAIRQTHQSSVLVGYSLGAAIALHLAAAHPPDVLILLAPFWRLNSCLAHLLPIVKYVVPRFSPFSLPNSHENPAMRAQMQRIMPEADLDDPAVIALLQEKAVLPTAVLAEIRTLGAEAYKIADQIHCPTLIIQGTQDDLVDKRLTRQLLQRLPTAVTYHEIPADHEFLKENLLFRQLVVNFLRHAAV